MLTSHVVKKRVHKPDFDDRITKINKPISVFQNMVIQKSLSSELITYRHSGTLRKFHELCGPSPEYYLFCLTPHTHTHTHTHKTRGNVVETGMLKNKRHA